MERSKVFRQNTRCLPVADLAVCTDIKIRHITGDALAIAKKHAITLEHVDYIQIHPTTLYSEKTRKTFPDLRICPGEKEQPAK